MQDDSPTGRATARAWQLLKDRLGARPVPSLVVAIGLGDGALLRALDAHAPGTRVLAFETDPQAAAAFHAGAWPGWRDRLTYLAAPDFAGEAEAWRAFPADPEDHVILVAPDVERAPTPGAVAAARTLKRVLYGARANADARRRFAPRYLLNALRNVPAMVEGRDLADLTGTCAGHAAVIVAAGPSLDRSIDDLRALKGRALVIAVDTALRPLLAAGIAPHLVVGLDPGEANARHFAALPDAPDTWLVSETALAPAAARHFGSRTLWFRVADHEPWPWLRSHGLDVQHLDVWGSVITAAFQVAVLAGCDPIVFVGADLSYDGRQPYARGTTYEFQWAAWAANGTLVEDAWLTWLAGATADVQDVAGRARRTTPALLAFRDWLASRAVASGRRIVNASGAGLLMGEGIVQATLAAALPAGVTLPAVSDVLPKTASDADRADRVAWHLRMRAVGADIGAARASTALSAWRGFAGDAWDPVAVAAALDASASALAGGGAPPSESSAVSSLPGDVSSRLPESMIRWRQWLYGVPSGDAPASADRDAYLGHAFRLLLELGATTRDTDLGQIAQRLSPTAVTPVTALFDWPERLSWRITALEALLGAAWTSTATPRSTDFFGRRPDPNDEATQPASESADVQRAASIRGSIALTALRLCEVADPADAIDPAVFASGGSGSGAASRTTDGSTCTVTVRIEDASGSPVDAIPLHVPSWSMARLHTGLVCATGDQAPSPDAIDWLAARSCDVCGLGTIVVSGLGQRTDAVALVRPRVLALAPGRTAYVSHGTEAGVVCVVPGASASLLLRPGGELATHIEWPRPIVSELRWGDTVVAWSNGTAAWEDPLRGYVMWRDAAGRQTRIADLPFRPSSGVVWNDRLYWTCVEPGLGTWAPGTEPESLAFAHPFLSLEARGGHLAALPLRRTADGRVERRVTGDEVLLFADGRTARNALGPLGPRTSVATTLHGLTAEAYPHADAVVLRRGAHAALRLVCYYPVRLAWLDDSLVVSTLYGDLLLFDGLAAVVDRLTEAP